MGGKSPAPPPPSSNNRKHVAEEDAARQERERIAAMYPHNPGGTVTNTTEDPLGSNVTTILGT